LEEEVEKTICAWKVWTQISEKQHPDRYNAISKIECIKCCILCSADQRRKCIDKVGYCNAKEKCDLLADERNVLMWRLKGIG